MRSTSAVSSCRSVAAGSSRRKSNRYGSVAKRSRSSPLRSGSVAAEVRRCLPDSFVEVVANLSREDSHRPTVGDRCIGVPSMPVGCLRGNRGAPGGVTTRDSADASAESVRISMRPRSSACTRGFSTTILLAREPGRQVRRQSIDDRRAAAGIVLPSQNCVANPSIQKNRKAVRANSPKPPVRPRSSRRPRPTDRRTQSWAPTRAQVNSTLLGVPAVARQRDGTGCSSVGGTGTVEFFV